MVLNHAEFVEKAEALTDHLRLLIEQMPSKGDVEADCQRLCLLNRVSEVEQYINGTKPEDLIEDNGEGEEDGNDND
jgi:phosphopantetheine adenylyltransferase